MRARARGDFNIDFYDLPLSVQEKLRYKVKELPTQELCAALGIAYDAPTNNRRGARILLFDLETAPLIAYVWSIWKQNIFPDKGQLIDDWFCLTWAAKWLFEDEIISDKITTEEVKRGDDSRIIRNLHKLINEADIIIAHNAKKFDEKRMNTRFIMNELGPPSPYIVIDTLEHARKRFSFTSNRLDYIARALGLTPKIDTGGFNLWRECMEGQGISINKMDDYCKGDIQTLEEVYLELRPYIKPHPNVGLHIADNIEVCPTCGSDDLVLDGTYNTYVNSYDTKCCNVCKSYSRSRRSNIPTAKKKTLRISVSR